MNEDRKTLMVDTRADLMQELNGALKQLKLQQSWETNVFGLLRDRLINNISVRGPFARAVHGYVQAQAAAEGIRLAEMPERFFRVCLPFIAELVINIQYLENHILDGKHGVQTAAGLDAQTIKKKLLASHRLKEFLYDYVDETVFPVNCPEREILVKCLRLMFKSVEEGQFMEGEWSRLEHVENGFATPPAWSEGLAALIDEDLVNQAWQHFDDSGMDSRREPFARFYLQRMYCTNALFFRLLAACIMDLAGYHGAERANIERFAAGFGLLGQMVNDVGDYIPASFGQKTSAKNVEDAFADLRNGNFTLPFLFAANDSFEETHLMLQLDSYGDEEQRAWFEYLRPYCIERIFPMLGGYAVWVNSLIAINTPIAICLKDFNAIGFDNRFFQAFWRRR
jgi:hypothetical protein